MVVAAALLAADLSGLQAAAAQDCLVPRSSAS
jgi:hypothetical protein